jgi:hypothetical protein
MRAPFYRPNGRSGSAVPRPPVLVRVEAEAGLDRVLADVLAGVFEVLLGLDHPGREAGAEQVAAAAVAQVEALGMAAAQVLDSGGELRLRRLDDRVVVVRHQAEGVDLPAVAVDGLRKELQEREPVVVVAHDRGPVDAARRHVEEPVRQLRAQDPRHISKLAGRTASDHRRGNIVTLPRHSPRPKQPSPWV